MTETPNPIDMAKYVSAKRALNYVQDGMRIGLGTGSTAAWMVKSLGEKVRQDGLRVTGVPTSGRTAELARQCGVPLATLEDVKWLDLTIDGADEFDGGLNLIKGGGGALLQEKIVAAASDMMVVVTDASKSVATLGAFPLPVEVVPFGWQTTKSLIEENLIGMDVDGRALSLRRIGDVPFRTDEGNVILDLHLERIGDAPQLAQMLNQIPGVVENGLFLDLCDVVVVGAADGTVEVRDMGTGAVTFEHVEFDREDNIFGEVAE